MVSIPDHGEVSFDEFQRQASLMTSCTLLWKELSEHFSAMEQSLKKKSEGVKLKMLSLEANTKTSLIELKKREVTIDGSVEIASEKLEDHKTAALRFISGEDNPDDSQMLKSYCLTMDARQFRNFVTTRKKDIDSLRKEIPAALMECIDPAKFVLEVISEYFLVAKMKNVGEMADIGWACVLLLESLIPVVADPVIGNSRMMITPSVKEKAEAIAETWKKSVEERSCIENVTSPDVHTFLQLLVTFGIVKKEDAALYRKLVVASAWRKQMPRIAVSLGLMDDMPDMIRELINKGQLLDTLHFSHETGLRDQFPPIPLLKAFLREAKKSSSGIIDDPHNPTFSCVPEASALRAVIKCIEEYKLEAEFPPDNLKKRLEQLEKPKSEKRKQVSIPPNKRTRACNNGLMPPAKAGRLTNAYVSSFPATPPFVRSPSHNSGAYPIYDCRSPPPRHAYSPEASFPPVPGPYSATPYTYNAAYGGYAKGFVAQYQPAYYL